MRKILAVLLLALLALSPGALAADYTISAYSMDVSIEADGSGRIAERLTYVFDGSYNGILSTLDVSDVEGWGDFSLYVDGDTLLTRVDSMDMVPNTYTLTEDGGMLEVKAYAPGSGGRREFRYEYTLRGLAQRYRDAARLNYRLIGLNNAVTLQNATLSVAFPEAPEHWFVHGAMDEGDLALAGSVLTAGPRDVAPGQYAEIDALFPASALYAAPLIDRDITDEALETEARLAEERAEAEEAQARMEHAARYGLMGAFAAIFIGMALLFRSFFARFGFRRAVQPSEDTGALDGLDAAVAGLLVRNTADESAFSATLLELTQMGVLSMAGEAHPVSGEKGTKFTVLRRDAPMSGQQQALFSWLFGRRDFLWIEDLDAGESESAARDFASEYAAWQKAVQRQAIDQGLYQGNGGKKALGVTLTAVLGIIVSVAAFALEMAWQGAAGLFLTAVLCAGFASLRPLTDRGEEKVAAVRGFCEKYGEKLTELPADALKNLPILVALGYVEPLTQYLERRAGEPDYGYGGMLPVWWYAGWYYDMGRTRHAFRDVRRHNASVVAKSSSSSGGGFSGSSGGGGGGGGHGAW